MYVRISLTTLLSWQLKPRPRRAVIRSDTGISTLSDGNGPVEMPPLQLPEHDGVAQQHYVLRKARV